MDVVGFCVGLPSQTRLHEAVENVRIQLLLSQGFEQHRLSENRQSGEDALLFRTQFGENLDRDVIFQRLVERSGRSPPVDEFQHQRVTTRQAVDVKPLLILKLLKTGEKFPPRGGIKAVEGQNQARNPSFCVLGGDDGFEGP